MAKRVQGRVCQYNKEVFCDARTCYHCGWDPEVAKERTAEFIAKMPKEKLYRIPFTGYCEVWAKSPEEAAEKAEHIEQQFFAQYDYGDPICMKKEEDDV